MTRIAYTWVTPSQDLSGNQDFENVEILKIRIFAVLFLSLGIQKLTKGLLVPGAHLVSGFCKCFGVTHAYMKCSCSLFGTGFVYYWKIYSSIQCHAKHCQLSMRHYKD